MPSRIQLRGVTGLRKTIQANCHACATVFSALCGIVLCEIFISYALKRKGFRPQWTAGRVRAVMWGRICDMWITNDQAAEIYARFCTARYGAEAIKVVRARIAELRKLGDVEGERIWNLVADKVEPGVSVRLHSAA